MQKFLFAGARARGRTRAGAQDHLLRRHGRMVVFPPADSGPMPVDYTQNHVIDGAYAGTDGPHAIERDLLTELWFEDMAHMQSAVATRYYLDHLRPDEPSFVDDATVAKMRVEPHEVRGGERGRYKIAWLLTHAADGDDAVIVGADAALSSAGFTRVVANTVMAPPGGAPFVDCVIEGWHHDLAAVRTLAETWPFGPEVDRDRSITLVLEEFTRDRLRTILA